MELQRPLNHPPQRTSLKVCLWSTVQYKTSLLQHKEQCTNGSEELPNPNTFQCTVCKGTFKEKKTFKDHIRGIHDGKECQCHVFGKLFRWRSSLSYHFKHFDHP